MNKKLIAKNPTAYHNYAIEDKLEAGLVLSGTEIKSIRTGKVNLKDTYATIKNGEVYIIGMHISPYEHGNIFNKDPLRDRKLYFKGSIVKLELGIGKGKKLYDKRQDIAKKDAQRRIRQQIANGSGFKWQ